MWSDALTVATVYRMLLVLQLQRITFSTIIASTQHQAGVMLLLLVTQ